MGALLTRWRAWVWVLPAVALLLVFVYYPIVDNLRLSFFSWNAFSPEPRFVGVDNYTEMFTDPVFWRALLNNIAYAVVSLVFQAGLSLVLAALLEELVGKRLRGLLRTLYFIPAAMSITVAGVLFSFLYNPRYGLVNEALQAVGLGHLARAWLGEESSAIWSVIAMSQWQSIGYTAVLFVVAMQRIPREYYEAAKVDGSGAVRTFFSITLPMVREMTTLIVILTISGAFLVFNEVMVMTAGGPDNSSQVLGTWLYRKAFFEDDMGYAASVATVIFVITFAIAAGQLALSRRRRYDT
ncbi:sugar ABC transporter permease [Nonomuraea roseoviolacea subsp. roseoviolacea]|uniref:Raffinose/stachyose/melibiose transport system permease protein n=1 Tax=Nonomuraea roseoviolacea subsp. carminata TaxID=160689 RepID=A0ABT1K9H8_9ACTN|nr:sugar ABC transporter permease [Nonomuraea roseoviolacea]MCP2350242.1 raffinose/stachyose/melibiose transport system permease protein [Nonomuraea roseoviolacea subsp. carminata]